MIVSERRIVGALLLLFSCYTLVLLPDGGAGHSRSPSAAHLSSLWTPPLSPPPRIAYVFAGSPRSFYCPKVHWSIKHYLMEGLSGDPYVFVRAAGNDNYNNHTGEGTTQSLPYTQEDIARLLARMLRPSAISWVQLGSPEEDEEMSRNFPGERHAIYRKYDRRRYSMFYHRSMAYRMVQDYEKKHGFKFDWVVMARLDTIWVGAPLPIHHFTPDRVYTPETGLIVNDQFMLIPRQYSDAVYDLNLRLEEGVICLGGPDVPRWHCSANELRAHNISFPEASMMIKECCSTVFGGKGDDQVGYSETILSRHLARAEVPLAPATFPFTISRLGDNPSISREDSNTCSAECFRLHQYVNSVNFYLPLLELGYPYTKDGYPSTFGRGASVSHVLRCDALGDSKALWQPKHALDLAPSADASQIFPLERLAAWRLRIASNRLECLTVHGDYITTAPCKELDRVRRYVREQIFLLQVHHHDPRDAAHLPLRMGAGMHPDSLTSTSSSGDEDAPATTSIVTWSEARGVVCLTVMGNTSDSEVTTAKCDLASPAQRWLVPKGRFGGHTFGSTVANLRPVGNPSLCIRGRKGQVEIALAPVKGRPLDSASPNTTTVAVLKLTVVKCAPILTDTNFDLESIE